MGRGRQKAKQTKVARELKYFSPDTDYASLQKELGTGESHSRADENHGLDGATGDDEPDDGYGSWASGQGR